ncbi:MAG: hypothetical protein IJZ82_12820 [Lachnospiraceae bacterium]|nr:hypothetical protein [Lachnospiraceae bacterium]
MNKTRAVGLVKAFLTAFAFLAVFHPPLISAYYETKIDYIIASIYELLGNYDFVFVVLLVVCCFFYSKVSVGKGYGILSIFFSFCILLGRSYHEVGNWSYCFGSVVNFTKFVLALAGYAVFFQSIMYLLADVIRKKSFISDKQNFFHKNGFLKAFLVLVAGYAPFLLLSYPGNLCWDVIGQIEQVIFQTGYSTHHPLVHTLMVGGITQLGMSLFGSYEIGLFAYVWLQTFLLAAAFAFTIDVLAKRRLDSKILWGILVLYLVTPIYSNLTSTAVKDVPFTAFVIGYFVCYGLILETPSLLKNMKFVSVFVLLQIAVILFRNNGMPLVLLSGLGAILFTWKKYVGKDRIKSILVYVGVSVVIGSVTMNLLSGALDAAKGSKGEILSIFFQQTARYLQVYQNDLSLEEKEAIEAVLGNVSQIADSYNPDISDPVKASYKKDATTGQLISYLMTWFKCFFKHPAVYFEAFFAHVYGWFTPTVDNVIRYETPYDVIYQGGLFKDANKVLIFIYRFANRFEPLGILENVGMAVWTLFFFTNYQRREGRKHYMVATLPLWVCLLICMASPCFFGHPRYALPIMACLPFLYGLYFSGKEVS